MKKALLIFGGLSLLGFGLYRYFKKQVDLLSQYDWKVSGLKVKQISLDNLSLVVTFLFTSKADIEAKVEKVYLELFLQNKSVGFITEEKPFIIPAKGSSQIPINISISPKLIIQDIVNLSLGIAKEKDIIFSVVGKAYIKSGFVSTTLPIEYKTSLKEYLKGIPTPTK
jgi:hypothetical protein